ncbi:MAG TPA: hypothetical protein PLB25_10605 [Rhodoferax sp.]|nr:hypothetical protein [Rhodoferax sp.]
MRGDNYLKFIWKPFMTRFLRLSSLALALIHSVGPSFAQTGAQGTGAWAPGQTMPQTRIIQGRNSNYALPVGWRVGEKGNHALVL